MAGLTGTTSQAPRLVSGFLNGEDLVAPGVPLASPSGSIVPAYPGMVGVEISLDADDALKYSNTAIGTLFGGRYKCVKTNAQAANLNRGRLVWWDTGVAEDLYQVHQLETLNGAKPLFAGVLLNTVTAGNYCWIQTAGRATVLCRAAVTAAKRQLFWSQAGAGADNATFDGLADATAVTGANLWETGLAEGEAVAANGALIIAYLQKMVVRY